jgi:hypothetical protein
LPFILCFNSGNALVLKPIKTFNIPFKPYQKWNALHTNLAVFKPDLQKGNACQATVTAVVSTSL